MLRERRLPKAIDLRTAVAKELGDEAPAEVIERAVLLSRKELGRWCDEQVADVPPVWIDTAQRVPYKEFQEDTGPLNQIRIRHKGRMTKRTSGDMEELVRIVSAADGEIVGRTRLQKTAFLLELAGLGGGYEFKYKHYGPFSEELASAVDLAPLLFDLREDQRRSGWGGTYSVFTSDAAYEGDEGEPYRQLVSLAKHANPIALELAATAAYLASVGDDDPWGETERRKPEKAAGGKLEQAKALYNRFKELKLPEALPDI